MDAEDTQDHDAQTGTTTKLTIATWRQASEPWTIGFTSLDGVVVCNKFLTSLRECLPHATQVREALSFAKLLMLHTAPPLELRKLHGSLWAAATLNDTTPDQAAGSLRELATLVLEHSDYSASGSVLELGLTALALQYDDRASHRMKCVELGLLFGGVTAITVDDLVPSWKRDGSPCFISPGLLRSWVAKHIRSVCALAESDATSPSAPSELWSCRDLECALLALRMQYSIFRTPLDYAVGADLLQDFEVFGLPVWEWLQRVLVKWPEVDMARPGLLRDAAWHMKAQREIRRVIRQPALLDAAEAFETREEKQPSARSDDLQPGRSRKLVPVDLDAGEDLSQGLAGAKLISVLTVCRSPIIKSSDRYDKEELARHRILETPLPLAAMPAPALVQVIQARLLAEFPWAETVVAAIFDELMGRAQLGVRVLGMPATLLVGPPGSGKSRLALRIAEELDIPRLDLALGGTSDSKVLAGTSRGWAGGKPNDLATLFATRKLASAIVMLDELDKAIDRHSEGGGVQSYLLGLLEPETARRHMDVYLKTECDLSGALWIATANRLSPIQGPLVSRLRVLMLVQPRAEHYPVIAENVLVEMAKRWSLERTILPAVDELKLPLDQLTSARQVRMATEAAVTDWARDLRRH